MQIEETVLPGIGKRLTFRELEGHHSLAIVVRQDGSRELHLNPDKPKSPVLKLSSEEARLVGTSLLNVESASAAVDLITQTLQAGLNVDQIRIPDDSPCKGKTLRETGIPESKASVLSLIRGGKSHPNPPMTEKIGVGDVLILVGPEDDLKKARKAVLGE